MPSLAELQAHLRVALLGEGGAALEAVVVEDGITADARLDIYRHHVLTSLRGALESTFPVVRRLVDPRFFAYAADRFVRDHPPTGPCLFEYGAEFPAFLAGFPPCRDLAYLADVARLEWALNVAAHADDAVALAPSTLAALDPTRVDALRFGFVPSLTALRSPWPIARIWRANQAEAGAEPGVALDAGGICLEVARRDDEVVVRELAEADYVFRRALLDGERLLAAAEAARDVDPGFDLTGAIAALLTDGSLSSFSLSPQKESP